MYVIAKQGQINRKIDTVDMIDMPTIKYLPQFSVNL